MTIFTIISNILAYLTAIGVTPLSPMYQFSISFTTGIFHNASINKYFCFFLLDSGWVYLRDSSWWQDHIHLRDSFSTPWIVSGTYPQLMPIVYPVKQQYFTYMSPRVTLNYWRYNPITKSYSVVLNNRSLFVYGGLPLSIKLKQ